jgi:hypothetical protein
LGNATSQIVVRKPTKQTPEELEREREEHAERMANLRRRLDALVGLLQRRPDAAGAEISEHDALITNAEHNELTRTPLGTLYARVHRGDVAHVRLGPRSVRYRLADIARLRRSEESSLKAAPGRTAIRAGLHRHLKRRLA